MQKAARRRLSAGQRGPYFDAAVAAAVAAVLADEAASAAAVAAVPADIAAEAAPESAGGVVTTVVEVDGVDVVAGGVIVVVDSSFLLHAANETAAARVTINNAVFMFLLDFRFGQLPVIVGTLLSKSPSVFKTRKARAFLCLATDYRRLRCFP
jgi:hypothetical protein